MTESLHAALLSRLPTRQHERWKYANLQFLKAQALGEAGQVDLAWVKQQCLGIQPAVGKTAGVLVMVNGVWRADLSPALPSGCHVQVLKPENDTKAVDAKAFPVAAMQQSAPASGVVIHISDDQPIELHILHVASSDTPATINPTLVLTLAKGAQCHLVEHVLASDQAFVLINQLTHVNVGEGATLDWVKIQTLPFEAAMFAHHEVSQLKNSLVTMVNVSDGARFARDETQVHLLEAGAVCKAAGFYQTKNDTQFVDNHIDIKHGAPHTASEMMYKGILDEKSQGVFNGRLVVEAGAQKISATQANHHLLLSNEAEAYAKPELEIYADDVKCKHGATTGQLNEEALFYLQSRGIEKGEARAMLMAGFMDEVMACITSPSLRDYTKSKVALT